MFFAAAYSFAGLAWAWRKEAAFRQEVLLVAIFAPVGLVLGETSVQRALLIGSLLLVLAVVLVISAIEATVDQKNNNHQEHTRTTKDLGSAAVFVALVN